MRDLTSSHLRPRCVLLCPPGNGADVQSPGSIPLALLRVLKKKQLDPHITVDAHLALASLYRFSNSEPEALLVLLVVSPDRVRRATELVGEVRAHLPSVRVWQHDESNSPALRAWPAPQRPTLRLTSHNADERATAAPRRDAPAPPRVETDDDGLVSDEEYRMLLAPPPPAGAVT